MYMIIQTSHMSFSGDVSEALDWYSKGVAELEKGVAVEAKGGPARTHFTFIVPFQNVSIMLLF